MLTWLTRLANTRKKATAPRRKPRRLALEWLEAREVPALTIQLDYSLDAGGFFNDPSRRAVLQEAANDIASQLGTSLAPIVPGGGNTWSESFISPATGQQVSIANPVVPADTIVVYVGSRVLGGTEAGEGGNGGYNGSGFGNWLDVLRTRGAPGYSLWGGSIAFDTATNFYFGSS